MNNDVDRRLLLGGLAGAAGVAALAAVGRGGPLNPPAGVVASTGRTLLEVEPRIPVGPTTTPGNGNSVYRISVPGSYYLTGNVVGLEGKSGISIQSDGVTLDLMGFEVSGLGAAGSSQWGIISSGMRTEVRNGTLKNWLEGGVNVQAFSVIQNVLAIGTNTTGVGFVVGNGCLAVECFATGYDIGFNLGSGAKLDRCVSFQQANVGFSATSGCVLTGCTASNSAGAGFLLNEHATLIGCCASGNLGPGLLGNGFMARDCTVSANNSYGINCGSRSNIEGCRVAGNLIHGILVNGRCVIRGNSSDGNGAVAVGHGIQVIGSGNRIEANHCTGNDRGIDVLGTGNLIIRNSVSQNSDFGYAVVAGNSFGPNIVPAGNPIATSSNPHANYEF